MDDERVGTIRRQLWPLPNFPLDAGIPLVVEDISQRITWDVALEVLKCQDTLDDASLNLKSANASTAPAAWITVVYESIINIQHAIPKIRSPP